MRRLRPTAVLATAATTITIALVLFASLGSDPGTAQPTEVLGTSLSASAYRDANLPAKSEINLANMIVRTRAAQRKWAAEHTPAALRARAARRKAAAQRRAAHDRALWIARSEAARQAGLRRAAIAQQQAAARQAAAQAAAQQAQAAAAAQQAAAQQQAAAAAAAAAAQHPAVVGAPAGFHPGECGGALPTCCIMMRESGGNPAAYNPSGAAGKWQFMPGTWAGYGGYASAAQAPEWVQDARAVQIWAGGAGAGNWAGDGCV